MDNWRAVLCDATQFVALLGLLVFHHQCAAEPCAAEQAVAQLVSIQEIVTVDGAQAAMGQMLCPEQELRTSLQGRGAVRFLRSHAIVHIDQSTQLRFRDNSDRALVDLIRGAISAFFRKPGNLSVDTPIVNAAIKGTEFMVRVGDDGVSIVSVYEGTVVVRGSQSRSNIAKPVTGSIDVQSGERLIARPGEYLGAANLDVAVAQDELAWSLYYPPIVDSSARNDLQQANRLLWSGRIDDAIPLLNNPALVNDPTALSIRATVAVVQSKKAQALELARSAVEIAPDAAAPRIALSYALQANFLVERALATLTDCLDRPSCDSKGELFRARLIELRLATGDLHGALKQCDDELFRGLALACGFAELANNNPARSQELFQRAVSDLPQHPLARLGVGLAEIRRGDITAGRINIEIAAALDPLQSVIRSYLGKSYFEERRCVDKAKTFACLFDDTSDTLAIQQYDIARALDPNDPTPDLYAALALQLHNRPIEGVTKLQNSTAKNNHRAVYRSSLLIDRDEATRSSGLGRLYGELGFGRVALNEGWNSLALDQGNYSAHRLLADSYSSIPRFEVARVSELLQSQMRQPLNATPIQPELGESDLAILQSAGPSNLSFNEYNPAFVRDGFRALLNSSVGANDTKGLDATLSSVFSKVSGSAGYFKYHTDGVRRNNDQDQEIFSAFAQAQVTSRLMAQAELRLRDLDGGDLFEFVDPAEPSVNRHDRQRNSSERIGFRYEISPSTDALVTLSHRNAEIFTRFLPFSGVKLTDSGFVGEGQLMNTWSRKDDRGIINRLTTTAGVGRRAIAVKQRIQALCDPLIDPSCDPAPSTDHGRNNHTNTYLYETVTIARRLDVTVGASFEDFTSKLITRGQINPKLGASFLLTDNIQLRGGAFRTLTRRAIANQSLEPTQLAGFNQFYPDPDGTRAWQYGVGLDLKYPQYVYAGAEAVYRDVRFSLENVGFGQLTFQKHHETLIHAYAYKSIGKFISIGADYGDESFDHDIAFQIGDFTALNTRSLRVTAGAYLPSGWSLTLRPRLMQQSGAFANGNPNFHLNTNDKFILADAEIGYRLPGRFGKVSIVGLNLLDKRFRYQDSLPTRTDFPTTPQLSPERQVFLRLSVSIY